jgi:uncharacterized protein (DUF362 family)
MARSIVSIVKDKDPRSAARKSVEILGGLENVIEKDARVLIKPNLIYGARYETGTTTNPTVLRTLVELIRPITRNIAIIESNFGIVPIPEGPMPLFREVEKVFGLPDYDALRKLGVRFIDLSREKKRWLNLTPNKILDKIRIPEDLYENATLVDVPVLKSHGITTVTLGLKNLYGLIPSPHVRSRLHDTISSVLSDLAELFSSIFTVIDGSIGMEGPASCFGAPAERNLMFASEDIVAADSVATKVMGYNPGTIGHIVEGAKRGLGNLDDVEVKGESVEEVTRRFNTEAQLPLQIVKKVAELGKARQEDLLSLYPNDTSLVTRYCKAFLMWGPLVREGDSYRFESRLLENFVCRRCVQTGQVLCEGWKIFGEWKRI